MEFSKRGCKTIVVLTLILSYASICFFDKAIDWFCLMLGV